MSRFSNSTFARLALIGMLAGALSVTGCGRKGPLDPPPGASLEGEVQPVAPNLMTNKQPLAQPIGTNADADNPGVGEDGKAQAPKGQRKHIPLDNLLN